MKAIFLKELRQWWRLGAVGLLIQSVVLFQRALQCAAELKGFRPSIEDMADGVSPLRVEPAKQWVVAAGMALFALAIGIAQSLADGERDRRAFLLHRPLSPRRIFLARSAAGLTLFGLAIGAPYAVFVAWAAIPGNVPAPWVPQMLFPTVIDAFGAVAYYFAGTLLTLRAAPWFGIRLVPLGAVIVCTVGTIQAESAAFALLFMGLSVAALTALAVEAFVSDGEFKDLSRAAQFLLMPIASLGGYWFWLPLLVLISLVGAHPNLVLPESNLMGEDGRFHRVRYESGRYVDVNASNRVVTPLRAALMTFAVASESRPTKLTFRDPDSYCFPIGALSDGGSFVWGSPTLWYYDRREDRVLAYDRASFCRIGVLGPLGYVETLGGSVPESKTGRFDAGRSARGAVWRSHLGVLPTSRAVYSFSPGDRTITKIFEAPGTEQVRDAERWRGLLAVETDNAVYVKRGDASAFIRVPIPESVRDYRVFKLVEAPKDEGLLMILEADFRSRKPGLPNIVLRVESTGAVLPVQSMEAPALSNAWLSPEDWLAHLVLPQTRWLPNQSVFPVTRFWVANLFWLGAAGLLCVRRGVPVLRALWWIVLTGVLGGLAVVALWMLESPTGRAGCPSCRGSRRIVDEKCLHCGASWSSPRDGTELFEPRLHPV